jgi:hypothetical protein
MGTIRGWGGGIAMMGGGGGGCWIMTGGDGSLSGILGLRGRRGQSSGSGSGSGSGVGRYGICGSEGIRRSTGGIGSSTGGGNDRGGILGDSNKMGGSLIIEVLYRRRRERLACLGGGVCGNGQQPKVLQLVNILNVLDMTW